MTRNFLLLLFLVSFLLSGCGGGGGASVSGGPSGGGASSGGLDSGTGPTGKIELSIQWPQASKGGKLIPAATDRVEVSVSGEGLNQPLFQSVARSQMQNNQAVISFPSVPVGSKIVEVKALDSANTIVAHRIKPVSVVAGQPSQVSAPLGMTATDQGFLPSQFSLNKGETLLLVNEGNLNHSVVKSDGSAITGVLPPGGFASYSPGSPGVYSFHCGIHPGEMGTFFVQFPPPVITGLSVSNGPTGSSLTITGNNFGAALMTGSSVTIGGVLSPVNSSNWSDTQIVCTVPGGAVTGNVVVTVSNVSSNGLAFTVEPFIAQGQQTPVGIIVIGNDAFWIENVAGGHVRKVPLSGGTPVALTPSSGLGVAGPVNQRGLTSSGDTLFWVDVAGADFVINKVNKDGTGYGTLATLPSSYFQSSTWLAADGARVYASAGNGTDTVLASAAISDGGLIYAKRSDASGPPVTGIEHDGNFLLTAYDWAGGTRIARADKNDTNMFSSPPASAMSPNFWQSMMYNVSHVVADNTYMYWVERADSSNNANTGRVRRRKLDLSTGVEEMVPNPPDLPNLPSPTRLRVDSGPSGSANRLYWVDNNGLHVITGASGAGPWSPTSLGPAVAGRDLVFVQGDPILGKPPLILWTAADGRIYKLEQ